MRILAFDLECTSLSGMVGRLLCGSVKDVVHPDYADGNVRTYRADDPAYRNKKDDADDAKLAVAIRDELEVADVIVGHNSKLFDRKFLNARLLKAGHRPLRQQYHIDTMWIVRTHLRISSKLDNVQKFLGLPTVKTPISWDDWMRGLNDNKAMNTIVEHCEADVRVLEEAYWRLLPYMRTIVRA